LSQASSTADALVAGQVQQHEAQQRRDGAQRHQRQPLRRLGQAGPQPLGGADDQQPGQHGEHRHDRAVGRQRQPLAGVAGDEGHAQRQQQLHAEHGPQHEADMADIEGAGQVQQRRPAQLGQFRQLGGGEAQPLADLHGLVPDAVAWRGPAALEE
jgi:hypothetical protein